MTQILEMTPLEMKQRAVFCVGLLSLVAGTTLLVRELLDRGGQEILDLDEISARKGKYEPYVQDQDGPTSIFKSLLDEEDLNKYLDPDVANQLPELKDGDNVGATWLVEEKNDGVSECNSLVLHYPSSDQYYVVNKTEGIGVSIANLSTNPVIKSQLERGGKIIDVLLLKDGMLRVLYEGNERQDDYMTVNELGDYVVER